MNLWPSIKLFFLLMVELVSASADLYAQYENLKLYNINDGLPSTSTHQVYQDKYGYLWISTPAGLSRFDGAQFVNYGTGDGLPSLYTGKVYQDSRERLWVGTNAGVAQFRNNRFIVYPTNDGMGRGYIFNFVETKDKQVWVLTEQGIYQFTGSSWQKVLLCKGFENSLCRNVVEKNGELYINYGSDIFCRDKAGKWIHIASRKDFSSFFNVMSVQDDHIWVSTDENIYVIQNYKLVALYAESICKKNFFSYLVDSKHHLWVVGENLFKISQPGNWQHFSSSAINLHEEYSSIIEDSSQNIWVGSSEGLKKIRNFHSVSIDNNNGVPLDGILNIISLPNNRLLFSSGTTEGLLAYSNNACKKIAPPPSPGNENYYSDPVNGYAFDEHNTVWMITRFNRFLHFDGKALKDFTNALHLRTSEYFYDINYAKKRKQFFICADATLLYGHGSNFSTFIPANTGVPIVRPTRVHELNNGLMLIYINEKGVYGIDTSNNLISLVKQTGIDGNNKGIQSHPHFYEESASSFWIAVPGMGLYEYGFGANKLPILKNHITVKDGIQSDVVLSIANDWQNRIWLATNAGLDILQRNASGNWEVFNYASAGDLQISKSDYWKLTADAEGSMLLSSPAKIIKFSTAAIKLYKQTPRIIIEKISLSFKDTDWSKLTDSLYSYYQLPYQPVLKYHQNSISIFYNAIDFFTSNSNPEYSYKILPLDTSWSTPSKVKSVSLTQLAAGKYQFIVRAKNRASGWSEPAVFGFSITPPFWDRWWFRLIIVVIAAVTIIIIFRARIRKIKRDDLIETQLKELEMKALKAQMSPHFIYNALNSIQALVASDKKKESIHYIGSFSRLLRQVLDNSESNLITLDKELSTIALYIDLEELRLDTKLQYKMIIAPDIVTEFEKIPPLILQPFIENALWHGLSRKEGAKEIKIRVSVQDDWLLCNISDNGIGRVKAQEWKNNSAVIHQSKAIDITRKRLLDFNDNNLVPPIEFFDLYDDNKNPSGTLVSLRIKRKSASSFI